LHTRAGTIACTPTQILYVNAALISRIYGVLANKKHRCAYNISGMDASTGRMSQRDEEESVGSKIFGGGEAQLFVRYSPPIDAFDRYSTRIESISSTPTRRGGGGGEAEFNRRSQGSRHVPRHRRRVKCCVSALCSPALLAATRHFNSRRHFTTAPFRAYWRHATASRLPS